MSTRFAKGDVVAGRYKVEGLLGQGGFAKVYRASHLLLENYTVAIKVLNRKYSDDEHVQRRFRREVEITSKLLHPNVIPIREFGVTDQGLLYFTMDYVQGPDLNRLLRKEKRLPWKRVQPLIRGVLRGLEAAHNLDIVHRDVKPANILISAAAKGREIAKVCDFGVAKIALGDSVNSCTVEGSLLGTPVYMSPEQCRGETVDRRADIYAIAIILTELLTGKPPFEAQGAYAWVIKHLTEKPGTLSELAPDLELPDWLEEVVLAGLAKDPLERYQTALEFADALGGPEARQKSGDMNATIQVAKAQPSAPEGMIGKVFDKYQMVELLSQSSREVVFRGRHVHIGREVAFKMPTRTALRDQVARDAFLGQANLLARLKHAALPTVYDFGILTSGVPFMAEELVVATPLDKILGAAPTDLSRALELLLPVVEALGAIHKQDMVHANLRPHHIWLLPDDDIKLLGTSRLAKSGSIQERDHECEAARWLSPEQISAHPVTPATDVYALGAMLFYFVSGRPPFDGPTEQDIHKAHVYDEIPDIRTFLPQADGLLAGILHDCMQKNAEARPADGIELLEQLLEIEDGLDITVMTKKKKKSSANIRTRRAGPEVAAGLPRKPPPRPTPPDEWASTAFQPSHLSGFSVVPELPPTEPIPVQPAVEELLGSTLMSSPPPPRPVSDRYPAVPPPEATTDSGSAAIPADLFDNLPSTRKGPQDPDRVETVGIPKERSAALSLPKPPSGRRESPYLRKEKQKPGMPLILPAPATGRISADLRGDHKGAPISTGGPSARAQLNRTQRHTPPGSGKYTAAPSDLDVTQARKTTGPELNVTQRHRPPSSGKYPAAPPHLAADNGPQRLDVTQKHTPPGSGKYDAAPPDMGMTRKHDSRLRRPAPAADAPRLPSRRLDVTQKHTPPGSGKYTAAAPAAETPVRRELKVDLPARPTGSGRLPRPPQDLDVTFLPGGSTIPDPGSGLYPVAPGFGPELPPDSPLEVQSAADFLLPPRPPSGRVPPQERAPGSRHNRKTSMGDPGSLLEPPSSARLPTPTNRNRLAGSGKHPAFPRPPGSGRTAPSPAGSGKHPAYPAPRSGRVAPRVRQPAQGPLSGSGKHPAYPGARGPAGTGRGPAVTAGELPGADLPKNILGARPNATIAVPTPPKAPPIPPQQGLSAGPGDTVGVPSVRGGQTMAVPLPPRVPPMIPPIAGPTGRLGARSGKTVALPDGAPIPGLRSGRTIEMAAGPALHAPHPEGGKPGSAGFRKIGRFTKVGPPPTCMLCEIIQPAGLARCGKCNRLVCQSHLTPYCCEDEAERRRRELLRGAIRIELMPGAQERMMVLPGPRVHFGRNRLREPKRNLPNDMVLRVLPCRSAQQDPDNWRTTNRISSKHGAFVFGPREAYVVDYSKLGIVMNGQRVHPDTDVSLPSQFELEIGAGAIELVGDQVRGRYDAYGARLEAIVLRRKSNWSKHFYVLIERAFGICMGQGHMDVVSPEDPSATVVLSRELEDEGAYSLRANTTGLYLDNEPFGAGQSTLLGPHHILAFGNGALEFNAGKIEDFTRL